MELCGGLYQSADLTVLGHDWVILKEWGHNMIQHIVMDSVGVVLKILPDVQLV